MLFIGISLLSACSVLTSSETKSRIENKTNEGLSGHLTISRAKLAMPTQWTSSLKALKSSDSWVSSFKDPQLISIITTALSHNFQLKQQALSVDIKKRQLLNAGSPLWPQLSANLTTSRRKTNGISNNASLSLNAQYELDLWGKLSANEQKANLEWLGQKALFEQAQQQLIVTTITAWYNAVTAEKLLTLNKQRAANTKQNLAIIESGYQQGLNSALDVYLTRNELNSALARVEELNQNLLVAKRNIETLIGEYPKATVLLSSQLANVSTDIPLGIPADILQQKPSLQASWYQLLASDAALAFAHKQRFPSISLSTSLNDQQNNLSQLLSASTLGWSLIGNITAPLFQAGRLKNNEAIAKLALRKQEQNYLNVLFQAFKTVENALTSATSLQRQTALQRRGGKNAQAAYKLAFERYQQGLVNYSTVLDAQNRWFDAQSQVIQLQNRLIDTRANLSLALGGKLLPTIITPVNVVKN